MIAASITLLLSIWQLKRGLASLQDHEKQRIENQYRLQGHWLEERLLLDNRTLEGAVGYWVFAPFMTLEKTLYWIRLGFYPTQARNTIRLPSIAYNEMSASASLVVHDIPWVEPLVWNAKVLETLSDRVWRTQQLNQQVISELSDHIDMNKPVVAHHGSLLSLVHASEGYRQPTLRKPYLKPYTHFGYAFQWLGLSAVASVFMFRFFKAATQDE